MGEYEAMTSPLALRRFPPEIRRMILQHMVVEGDGRLWKCMGKRSPIIIAVLRGQRDQELYFEALSLYYELNIFLFSPTTFRSFERISEFAVKSMRQVHIKGVPLTAFPSADNKDLSATIFRFKNVKTLRILTQSHILLEPWVKKAISSCTHVKKLKICRSLLKKSISPEMKSQHTKAFGEKVIRINQILGVNAKLGRVNNLGDNGTDEWFWEAPNNGVLAMLPRGTW